MFETVLRDFFTYPEVQFLLAHVAVNLTLAVAVAIKEAMFDFRKVAGFLTKKLAPNLMVYLIARFAGAYAGLGWLTAIAWAAITTSLTGDMLDNLTRLGLKVPDAVMRLIGTDLQ